jgi:hypothetical protein
MFEAKARAGGSVMLPASRPLRSIKFIFKTARAKMPMSMSGTTVTHAPASSHCRPVALKTVAKNFAPAPRPGDPEEKRDEVRFVEFPERVADGSGGFVKIVGHTDNLRLVAKIAGRPAEHGGHLKVGAGDTRNANPKSVIKVEFADGLAEYVAIGDNDAAESERAVATVKTPFFISPAYSVPRMMSCLSSMLRSMLEVEPMPLVSLFAGNAPALRMTNCGSPKLESFSFVGRMSMVCMKSA